MKMSNESTSKRERECPVCYGAHDAEIHEATLRVHRWFFSQVTHNFEDDELLAPELAAS
jgi:hypothetical protein